MEAMMKEGAVKIMKCYKSAVVTTRNLINSNKLAMEKSDECLVVRKPSETIIVKSLCAYECVSFGKLMFNALCIFKVFICAVMVGCQVIQSTKIYIQSIPKVYRLEIKVKF